MIPALMAVNVWAIINYQGDNPGDPKPPVPKGDPVDMSTGENLVREEGLQLATPGMPLSFDLNYNSGNDRPGILGRGWDLSLNWQLSLIYKAYYYNGMSGLKYYGAALDKYVYLANGPLSAANADFPLPPPPQLMLKAPVKKNLLDWLLCTETLEIFGPDTATAEQPDYSALVIKWFLISDGTRKYRVEGGWNNTTGALPDWDMNGGHYTEMPVDWELVHTNSEYRLFFPGKKWLTFSDDGRMAAMGDAWGNTITRTRNGDTETYSHSSGRWLKLIYGTSNLVSEIQTDDGRGMRFTYSNDCLASVEWSGGAKSRAHYYNYENNRLVQRINAEGTVSQYGYDSQGKATSMNVSSNWFRHTVTYGSTPQIRFYGHGTNWAEDCQFDSLGRLAGIIGPWNASAPKGQQGVYYSYDKWRNIVAERYFEGSNMATLTNRYDDHHRVLEGAICNGANTQRLFTATWSAEDRLPSSISNADELALNLEYTNGVVSLARLVGGAQTEETIMSGWDVRGMPGVVRDARAAETHLAFNADGLATTVHPPAGPGYGFEYDVAGQVRKVNRLEPGDVTRTLAEYERDGFGQITKATYADGLSEQFAYDPMRRLTNAVDRAGRQTHWEYWPIGKVKSVTRSAGTGSAPVRFDYDEQGTDLKITDELGRVVEGYALDVAGRPTAVTNILGQTLQVNYAIFDLPQQIRRFDGSYVNFAYDVAWRPATIQYPDDTVNLTYSAGGLLQTVSDGTGTISNKYDAFSRWAGQIGTHSWDEVTVANSTGGLPASVMSVGGTVAYGCDQGRRITNITSQSGGTFGLSYNPTNGLIAGMSCAAVSATYTFDPLDRVSNISWKDALTNVVCGFAYGYNSVGMITQEVTTLNGQLSTNSYTYDSLDRLTSETIAFHSPQSSAISLFTYDLVGNRTQSVVNGETVNYVYAPGNRLVSWGTNGQQQFDAAGNVTNLVLESGERLGLKWDSRYRVTSVYTNGGLAESYGYDALDRRISIADSATTNYLVYDGPHVIAEVGTSGSLVRSYTYGPGIDNILTMTVHTGETAVTYYYLKDHLGSVQAVVDASGSIVESYQYDAWGNTSVFDGSGNPLTQSAIGNRFCWQGREISWKTRLYYFRARWYEPTTGRWLSNDPIGISGGLNQYVFCGGNPVNWIDPFGLAYFGSRPLGGAPWIPGASHDPIDDFFNTEISHEQLFFEDTRGGNIGFFDDGTLKEERNPMGYRKTRTGFDDALMREAIKHVPLKPYHLLWKPFSSKEKFNCQDWGKAVRREYERLRKEREKQKCK